VRIRVLLFDHAAAKAVFAIVEDGRLAGGDALVLFGESDFEASVRAGFELAGLKMGAVADFGLKLESFVRLGGAPERDRRGRLSYP
jgi:hypothetical protein